VYQVDTPGFINFLVILSSGLLPKPKGIINQALGTILSAFEDINQMEVIRVRWEEIKRFFESEIKELGT